MLMFIGKLSRRSEEALERREKNRQERKGKGRAKGKDTTGKGQGLSLKEARTSPRDRGAVECISDSEPTAAAKSGPDDAGQEPGCPADACTDHSEPSQPNWEGDGGKAASSASSERPASPRMPRRPPMVMESKPKAASPTPATCSKAPPAPKRRPTSAPAGDHDRGPIRRRQSGLAPSLLPHPPKIDQWYLDIGGSTNHLWTCPWCGTHKDNMMKLQNHVWSKKGEEGHPTEKEQRAWYPGWKRGG